MGQPVGKSTLFTSTQGEEKVPSLDAASPFQAAVISIAISLMRRSNVGEEFGAGWRTRDVDVGGVGKPLIYTTTKRLLGIKEENNFSLDCKSDPKYHLRS